MQKGECSSALSGQIVRFARFLKVRGFRVFLSGVIDAEKSLLQVNMFDKTDFMFVLRANLASSALEWEQFPVLFDEFWNKLLEREEEEISDAAEKDVGNEKTDHNHNGDKSGCQGEIEQTSGNVPLSENLFLEEFNDEVVPERKLLQIVGSSPDSSLYKKDLSKFDYGDIRMAHLELNKMIQRFRLHLSRRYKKGKRNSTIDLPKTIRRGSKYWGFPLELTYKQKRKKVRRLVVLADVSGSMQHYAGFVMPFILGFRGLASRTQVFVFSTCLTCITSCIRHNNVDRAVQEISQKVPGWSGGTRIGYSFQQFNKTQAHNLSRRQTVVIILSDGMEFWGEAELLKKEMEFLSSQAFCIIWLNPKVGDTFYKPLYTGMAAALPFVDHLLPADSLQSLKKLGRLLPKILVD